MYNFIEDSEFQSQPWPDKFKQKLD